MPRLALACPVLFAFAASSTAFAATPESYAKLDKASEAACLTAAKLNGATVGPPIRFSDRNGIDARIVTGKWPQPHLQNAPARLLCLYNRKNKRVEVQELAEPAPATPPLASAKDIWWRAVSVGGAGIAEGGEFTLMLGRDGKIGGKSGCNGYSANYALDGETLKLMPPIVGTRMACAPAIMAQEQAFRSLLESAQSLALTAEGALVLTSAGGATSRFERR